MKIKEPKFGSIVSVRKQKYVCVYGVCRDCDLYKKNIDCQKYECRSNKRKDGANVIFKKIIKKRGKK